MKIGIIALGLIGGSLLKKLSENKNLSLYAVTRNKKSINEAKLLGAIASDDINLLKDCDIVFACTPIDKTIETLDKLENIVSKDCIVSDVSSVKEFVMKKERKYKFIGSHPMAGTENNGFNASFPELFEEAKWVITPNKNSKNEDIKTLKDIIKSTGAVPVITNAKDHDFAVAQISHLPMLIAQSLFASSNTNKLAMTIASSGFRDTTRLAMTNPELAKDMLKYNKENIKKAFEEFRKTTESNTDSDLSTYQALATIIKTTREKMYSRNGKNTMN